MEIETVDKDEFPTTNKHGKWKEVFARIERTINRDENACVRITCDDEQAAKKARMGIYEYCRRAGYGTRVKDNFVFIKKEN